MSSLKRVSFGLHKPGRSNPPGRLDLEQTLCEALQLEVDYAGRVMRVMMLYVSMMLRSGILELFFCQSTKASDDLSSTL